MEPTKKILLALPSSLLQEFDRIAVQSGQSRSALIRSVLDTYVKETRRQDIIEQMKAGYRDMGDFNLAYAEEAIHLDTEQQISYEETLSECE